MQTDDNRTETSTPTPSKRGRARRANEQATDTSYVIVCISIYDRDLVELDAKVEEMKKRGRTDMNRSKLIRLAVAALDVDTLSTRPQ